VTRREPPEVSVLLQAVQRARHPAPGCAFFPEVRNTTGAAGDVLRFADAIAIKLFPAEGWHVEGFEVKRDVRDLDEELRHPEKSAPFRLFCRRWWFVYPILIRDGVLLRLDRIPIAWGVLEVDGRRVELVREALDRREAEAPSAGFLKSLLRASRREATGNARGMVAGVPLVPVARKLDGDEVELACGHVVDRPPLAKVRRGERPPDVPCVFCGEEERPATPAAVRAALAKATPDELAGYERVIRERRAADERRGAA
jgi:hypothetical protein